MDKYVELTSTPEDYQGGGIFVSGQFVVRPEKSDLRGIIGTVVMAIQGQLYVLSYEAATALAYGLVQSLRVIDDNEAKKE